MSREILKGNCPHLTQFTSIAFMLIAIRFSLQYNFMLDWLPR